MKSLAKRRITNIALSVIVAVVVLIVYVIGQGTLRPSGFLSGWLLFGLVVFLAMYNVRKMLPFLPLGSSAGWLQFHIYCGFVSFLMFVIHLRFRLPSGLFECGLAAIYLSVFSSGVIGLYITRTYPRRLTGLGNEIVYEQIPIARRQVHDQIESLMFESATESGSAALPEFYRQHIQSFVAEHHDWTAHLLRGSTERHRTLLDAIADQRRYLNDAERNVLAQVESLVNRKHQIDAQYALQGALKIWLFFHVPATYALLIFAVLHVVLVHAWNGGLA